MLPGVYGLEGFRVGDLRIGVQGSRHKPAGTGQFPSWEKQLGWLVDSDQNLGLNSTNGRQMCWQGAGQTSVMIRPQDLQGELSDLRYSYLGP